MSSSSRTRGYIPFIIYSRVSFDFTFPVDKDFLSNFNTLVDFNTQIVCTISRILRIIIILSASVMRIVSLV